MQAALIPISDLKVMAQAISNSGLYSIKSADQALALMLLAQARGQHPAIVADEWDIIQGRPAMKAYAMLAHYQSAGGKIAWKERTDAIAEAEFTHPSSGVLTIRWTLDMAKNAGLLGKDNWRKNPRQMLSCRVISEGVKASFPGCVGASTYTPEEVMDFEPAPASWRPAGGEAIPWQPPAQQEAPAPPLSKEIAPPVAQGTWAELLGDRIGDAFDYLVIQGWLKPEQGMNDLKPAHSDRIRRNVPKFLEAVEKELAKRRGNENALQDATLTAAQQAVKDVLGGRPV